MAAPWMGILEFPGTTQQSLMALLNQLQQQNLTEMTILLLGKSGAGKSSTVNSLFGERVVNVNAFQAETQAPVQVARTREGFTINVIDTPGLAELGSLSETKLDRILFFCKDKTINAMLYVDRLDAYRVDNLDRQIIKGITKAFGQQIWKIGSLVLTHANLPNPSDGSSFSDFSARRSEALAAVVRQEGRLPKTHQVPVLLVENSSRVQTNTNGEKILPNGEVYLLKLVEGLVNTSIGGQGPVTVTQELIDGPDANRRGKIFIPILVALQFFFILRPLRRAVENDADLDKDNSLDWELRAEDYIRKGGQRTSLQKQAAILDKSGNY